MPRLDEKALRKPTFQEDSTPIRMADGQDWLFPNPWVQVRPRFENGKIISASSTTTHGPEFDAMVTAVTDEEDLGAAIMRAMELGAFLLRVNYELTDEDLDELFVYYVRDEASHATIQAICDVATGKAPKR